MCALHEWVLYLRHLASMYCKWETATLPVLVIILISIAPAEQLRKPHRMNANLVPASMRTRQHGCARGVNYR